MSTSIAENLDIVVLSHPRKKCLTSEYLTNAGIRFIEHTGKDYEWGDTKIHEAYLPLTGGNIGQYRCYRAHQDGLALASKDYVLVLEDDAIPNRPDWADIVLKAVKDLDAFNIISLHGRDWEKYPAGRVPDSNLLIPSPVQISSRLVARWVLGSLAYVLPRNGVVFETIKNPYIGLPMDLYIANMEQFALVDPSPFDHVRTEGSLIDTAAFNYV